MPNNAKYESLTERLPELIGGKENVQFFTHCVTRLRFVLKDRNIVQFDEIKKLSGVMGAQWSGDQLQIIIGQSVGDAYDMLTDKMGLQKQEAVEENLDGEKKKFSLNSLFDFISGCLTPTIPVLIGCGFLKIITMVMTMAGVSADNGTFQVLSFAGDAGFYFLPVLLGFFAARKTGANPALGALLGAILIHPAFIAAVGAGTPLNIYGLPIYPGSYTSSVIPVLLSVAVMAPIEKFVAKHSPEVVRSITEPLITLLIVLPLSLCLLAPLGSFIGTYIANAIVWLYETFGFVGVAVFTALCPLLVLTGMHSAMVPYMLQSFTSLGWEPILLTGMIISNINQGAACLAVSLKSKNKEIKSLASGCAATAVLGGVTEPGMFGINLKYKTPLYGAMIGSAVGGAIAGIGKAVAYAVTASAGIFALPIYLPGGTSNVAWMVAGIVVGFITAFVATWFLYKDQEQ